MCGHRVRCAGKSDDEVFVQLHDSITGHVDRDRLSRHARSERHRAGWERAAKVSSRRRIRAGAGHRVAGRRRSVRRAGSSHRKRVSRVATLAFILRDLISGNRQINVVVRDRARVGRHCSNVVCVVRRCNSVGEHCYLNGFVQLDI